VTGSVQWVDFASPFTRPLPVCLIWAKSERALAGGISSLRTNKD